MPSDEIESLRKRVEELTAKGFDVTVCCAAEPSQAIALDVFERISHLFADGSRALVPWRALPRTTS